MAAASFASVSQLQHKTHEIMENVSDKLQHQEGIYNHLEMGSSNTATGKLFHTLQMESGNTSSCVSCEMKEPEQHVSAPVVAAPVFAGGEDTAVGSSQSNASYYQSMVNDVTMWMTSTFGKFLDSEEHLTSNEEAATCLSDGTAA
ncbi:uncharacterized protein LOC126470965 [Schistocerca serialis cubense]|uniref:uncharacterized protein LOC126470965 n=1 Tax=Schistocerca serialis cubense TaxID=2023355 RepID=UPI00214F0784|nr:uncharacterized protein LOC126470965 [Schistocerca serialis cubense]